MTALSGSPHRNKWMRKMCSKDIHGIDVMFEEHNIKFAPGMFFKAESVVAQTLSTSLPVAVDGQLERQHLPIKLEEAAAAAPHEMASVLPVEDVDGGHVSMPDTNTIEVAEEVQVGPPAADNSDGDKKAIQSLSNS